MCVWKYIGELLLKYCHKSRNFQFLKLQVLVACTTRVVADGLQGKHGCLFFLFFLHIFSNTWTLPYTLFSEFPLTERSNLLFQTFLSSLASSQSGIRSQATHLMKRIIKTSREILVSTNNYTPSILGGHLTLEHS